MSQPQMLGTYQLERELGRGGMGVVYLARDPRLNRSVAIKVIPEALAQNPDNLARFEREAKLLAALNHPNIAAIYGVEEVGGQRLLVLEYVPGDTLAERLARGALPVQEALDVARQIAAAIEAAHEGGIIHRDLKPGNVKVTPDGLVKVLDFGLAKGGTASSADLAQSPTLTYSPTGIGVILGTAGYMSPEQARGKPVDRRADIWAFACVLFECLTGRKAFEGDTVSDTIARIIEREPDWNALPSSTPPAVRELLRRCLEKDIRKRQRDIGDVRIEVESALAARASQSNIAIPRVDAPRSIGQRLAIPALTGVAGILIGVAAWSLWGPSRGSGANDAMSVSVEVPPSIRPTGMTFTHEGRDLIVVGFPKRPDGSEDTKPRIYLRPIGSFEFKEIPGTAGMQFWSRSTDGRELAVVVPVSDQSSDSRLMRVPVDGQSPAVAVMNWTRDWNGLKWLRNGDMLTTSANNTKLVRLPQGGGSPKPAMALDSESASGYLTFGAELPNGAGIFIRLEAWGPQGYQQDLYLVDPETAKARRILENASAPFYDPVSRHLFFARRGTLHAAPFDPGTGTVGNDPVALQADLRSNSWNHGQYEIGGDGTLAFEPGGRVGADRRIVTVDASRQITAFISDARSFEATLAVTADGRQIAVVIPNTPGTYEIWTATAGRPGLRRTISMTNADCASPVWSFDGQWIAFQRNGRDKDDGVYIQRADGAGDPRPVLKVPLDQYVVPTGWMPDGSGLFVTRFAAGRYEPLFVRLSNDGTASPAEPMRAGGNLAGGVVVSPDGKLAGFVADDAGRPEVWVSNVVSGKLSGVAVPVGSTGTPEETHWAADGARLFFRDGNRIMMSRVERSPSLRASPPVLAYDLKALRMEVSAWDVMPDGRLIAAQLGSGEDDIRSFNLILNWLESARKKLKK